MSGGSLKGIPSFKVANYTSPRIPKLLSWTSKSIVASRRDNLRLINKRSSRKPRRLITISTTDGRWQGNWSSDYLLSFQDLQLEDLIEDEYKDGKVSISLSIQKHASFGLSVDGRIITSFGSKCCKCFTPYCREVDTSFDVWVLPSSSSREDPAAHLPEIGGDDPSVIYVKPGCEAVLDSLVQDTIRLTAAVTVWIMRLQN
uniref:Uncharacterized protein LOC105641023 isoform X2 n=1 Tax=Rhizophora mucronata TaxID=61149 RepID=A0A2P2LCW1_RHIMU